VPDPVSKVSPELLRAFAGAASRTYYGGAPIYKRGTRAQGVFLVQAGQVKLCPEPERRQSRFHIAGPGVIIGLGESMSGQPYDATAEPVHAATLAFLAREDLLDYLREHCDSCLQLVQLLSEHLHQFCEQYRRARGRTGRRSGKKGKPTQEASGTKAPD
jgi:CRP-like cAMP-binding protein